MILCGGQVLRTESRDFAPLDVWIEGERILGVGARGSFDVKESQRVDVSGLWIVPGLVDVHTHGRIGYDFSDCTREAISAMAADYARRGVTTVMPTVATASYEQMIAATDQINRFAPAWNEADLCGVHWEGRYMNPKRRGAHAEHLLGKPTAKELDSPVLHACKRLHISAALELDGTGEFAEKALLAGATLGLGHTDASYAEAKVAEERGIVSYTHLFNCMPPLHHRDGGAVCAALEGDRIAELISDGVHISPEMIRLVYRCKGVDGISLISDSVSAAGVPDGPCTVGGLAVTVKDGIARTDETNALAGSTLCLGEAVNRFSEFCRIPLSEAIVSATATPARQVGAYGEIGSIEEGKRADLILMKTPHQLIPERILLRGQWLNP